MQIASKPLLRIEARAENGITLVPKGPLAPVAKPVIDRINRVFADEKPISSGPDKFIFSTWIPPAPSIAFDRMISAQIGALTGRKIPDQFSIAVMRACPNDCIHCSAPSRLGENLSLEVVEKATTEALELGSYLVTFDGGEPMLRKELPEMVSHIDDRAITTAFTSGHKLTADLACRLKQAGLYAVRISIDSPHEAEHDRVRGRIGAFKDALSGIRNALDAGLLVDMFMVTSPSNIDHLEDAHALASELGSPRAFAIRNSGGWKMGLSLGRGVIQKRHQKARNISQSKEQRSWTAGHSLALHFIAGYVWLFRRAKVDSCGFFRRCPSLRLHAS